MWQEDNERDGLHVHWDGRSTCLFAGRVGLEPAKLEGGLCVVARGHRGDRMANLPG